MTNTQLSPEQREALLQTLQTRFEKNTHRHPGLDWTAVPARLAANPEKLWSLNEMERTAGEPDVVSQDEATGEYIFYDCAAESPKGRRSLCYDNEALESRKDTQTGRQRGGHGRCNGHRAINRISIPCLAASGRVRHQDI
jgi:hypothetical protein